MWVTCHYGSRGSSAIVASCLCCCFEGPKFFRYFVGRKFFSSGYFVNLEGLSWVQKFFSWLFRGSKFFSSGYFVNPKFFSRVFRGPKVFLLVISWVQIFFSGVFRGSKIFCRGYFVVQRFSVFGCMRMSDRKQKHINTSKTAYSNC